MKPGISSARSKSRAKAKTVGIPWWAYVGIAGIAFLLVLILVEAGRPKTQTVSVGPDASIHRGVTEDGFQYLGNPDAPVTIREYEDFGCHNCRDFVAEVEPSLVENYIVTGKVRLVSYPLAFVNQESLPGAEAAACAVEMGKFWEYRHLLFANQGISFFTRTNLVAFAGVVGLNMDVFGQCLDQHRFRGEILDRTRQAQSYGITGTPTFEIGGKRYPGVLSYDSSDPANPGMVQLISQAAGGK